MYSEYYNFKLHKQKDFIIIGADGRCIMEKKDDDFISEYKFPECLENIIYSKLLLSDLSAYYIFTFTVQSPNSITDYKKIWGLGGFKEKGFYDGFYDIENGRRVYFGVCKEGLSAIKTLLFPIVIYTPNNSIFPDKCIADVLKSQCFESIQNRQMAIDTVTSLYRKMKDSIIVYGIPYGTEIYVAGEKIEEKFSSSDLPQDVILEY